MTALQAALLGMVQGLTEFLPVSSSAHLLLGRAVFGIEPEGSLGLSFDVACHTGTLLAVLLYFRRDIAELTQVLIAPRTWQDPVSPVSALFRAMVFATLPVLVIGITAVDFISGTLRTMAVAGASLALGAVAMLVAERVGAKVRDETTLGTWEAVAIGCGQSMALIPGVSRSGAVLIIALLLGLRRDRAARFAFLLGIPVIAAAASKAMFDLAVQGVPAGALILFTIGIVSSAVVGYVAVRFFIQYVSKYSLDVFAAYRVLVAVVILFWSGS